MLVMAQYVNCYPAPSILTCFQLCDVKCQVFEAVRNASEQNLDLVLSGKGAYVDLRLTTESEECIVGISQAQAVALLNCKATSAFVELSRMQPDARLNAYAKREDLRNAFGARAKGKKRNDILTVTVNVCGPRDEAPVIGDLLSLHEMFLQDPVRGEEKLDYHNPHILEISGVRQDDVWLKTLGLEAERVPARKEPDWLEALDNLQEHHATDNVAHATFLTIKLMR